MDVMDIPFLQLMNVLVTATGLLAFVSLAMSSYPKVKPIPRRVSARAGQRDGHHHGQRPF